MLLCLIVLILTLSARAETPPVIRLHVVAADDTPAAQALKLKVRDAVLEAARAILRDAPDADAAWAAVRENRAAFEAAARGFGQPARCEAGVFPFPERRYGDVTLPAGDYRALRVVIGAGAGRNWWCVLYPALCYPPGADPAETPFHSVLLDWLRGLFGGEAS